MKNKKILICIGLLIVLLISGISVMAQDILEHERIEVIFVEESIFNEEEKQFIESSFVEPRNEENMVPYGLQCTLFGHDYKSEYVTVITHKVNVNAPRCLEEIYKVSICTRCSDEQSKLMSYKEIDCCK